MGCMACVLSGSEEACDGNLAARVTSAQVWTSGCLHELPLACRSRMPGKGGTKKAMLEHYEVSIAGLDNFKSDLDLLAANCKQFWGRELDMLQSQAAEQLSAEEQEELAVVHSYLEHADNFQGKLEQVFKTERGKVDSIKSGWLR